MLQQLSSELERAEKCREEAERAKSSKDDKLARLQLELEKCAKELARRQHHIHADSHRRVHAWLECVDRRRVHTCDVCACVW